MKLEKFAYNIYYMTNISLTIYNEDVKIYETNQLILPDQLIKDIDSQKQAIIESHKDNRVIRVQNKFGLTFLCIFSNPKNVLIGPFLINDDYEKYINTLILQYRLINNDSEMLESFYNSLKILSDFQQNIIVNILNKLNFLEEDLPNILNVKLSQLDLTPSNVTKDNDYTQKQIEKSIEIEDMLINIVKNGDVDTAQKFDFQNISTQHLVYRNNSFTNMKTNLMIFDALCNREAIKAGVDLVLANKISVNLKFHINKISLSSEIRTIAQKILITYAKAVRDYTLLKYSTNIRKIILYIRKNLTSKISLEDIAKDLYITKEHLSRLFKKEMGITISEYIIQTKIEEAKTLLNETDYNILDIAVLLNFANSSHFSNSFKKVTGLSPSDYRKKPIE